jgi:hypothetical protein
MPVESQRRSMGTLLAKVGSSFLVQVNARSFLVDLLRVHQYTRDLRHEHRTYYKGSNALRHWCYALHAFLAVIHVVLVVMLFRHPEHRVTVPADSTILTVGLTAFLQAIYTVRLFVCDAT